MNSNNKTSDLDLPSPIDSIARKEMSMDYSAQENIDAMEEEDAVNSPKRAKYAQLTREEVELEVAKACSELPELDRSKETDALPAFNDFHGFPLPKEPFVSFFEPPHEFAYLWELLNAEPDEKLFDDPEFDRHDYIKEHIASDVDAMHVAESIAIVSELPCCSEHNASNDIDGSTEQDPRQEEFFRLKIAADQYASYDEFRRAVALSKLIIKHDFDEELLDDFEQEATALFDANTDRILVDKCKKLVKLARLTELRGEIMTRVPIRSELLKK